jgi:cyclic nucleotide gated channel
VVYQDNSFIFQIGEPLDRILFITEGLVWTYEAAVTSNSNSCTSQDGIEKTGFCSLQKGGFYGDDQLVSWAIASDKNDLSFGNLPISNANMKCHAKVEGFLLMAKDLKTVVSNRHWGFHDSKEREEAASQTIQKAVRRFKDRQTKRHPLMPILEDEARPLRTVVDADKNWPAITNKDL